MKIYKYLRISDGVIKNREEVIEKEIAQEKEWLKELEWDYYARCAKSNHERDEDEWLYADPEYAEEKGNYQFFLQQMADLLQKAASDIKEFENSFFNLLHPTDKKYHLPHQALQMHMEKIIELYNRLQNYYLRSLLEFNEDSYEEAIKE